MNTLRHRVISHRGNIEGPDRNIENMPTQIDIAIKKGYDVEIDVWFLKEQNLFYLGHDKPEYEISLDFLCNRKDFLWCHAKNIDSLFAMKGYNLNFFWHQSDDAVMTTMGYIWTYPGKKLTPNSICVMPEINYNFNSLPDCLGYCTDYPNLIL